MTYKFIFIFLAWTSFLSCACNFDTCFIHSYLFFFHSYLKLSMSEIELLILSPNNLLHLRDGQFHLHGVSCQKPKGFWYCLWYCFWYCLSLGVLL